MNLKENKRIKQAKKQAKKQANKTSESVKSDKTEKNYSLIREYLEQNGLSKTSDIANYLGLSPARTRVILSNMQGVTYVGTTNNRKYKLEVVGNR